MPTTVRSWSGRRRGWEDRETLTIGEVRQILERAQAEGLTGMSRVNKGLTKQQAYDILSGVLEEGKADDEPVEYLAVKNIQREFGGL